MDLSGHSNNTLFIARAKKSHPIWVAFSQQDEYNPTVIMMSLVIADNGSQLGHILALPTFDKSSNGFLLLFSHFLQLLLTLSCCGYFSFSLF